MYVFSVEGAAFIAAWGGAPRKLSVKGRPALTARFISGSHRPSPRSADSSVNCQRPPPVPAI